MIVSSRTKVDGHLTSLVEPEAAADLEASVLVLEPSLATKDTLVELGRSASDTEDASDAPSKWDSDSAKSSAGFTAVVTL